MRDEDLEGLSVDIEGKVEKWEKKNGAVRGTVYYQRVYLDL
jgi:hypothetical protein